MESTLVTLLSFCCVPVMALGAVGIVHASNKVEPRWLSGNREGALRAAKAAKQWTVAALVVIVLIVMSYRVCFLIILGLAVFFQP